MAVLFAALSSTSVGLATYAWTLGEGQWISVAIFWFPVVLLPPSVGYLFAPLLATAKSRLLVAAATAGMTALATATLSLLFLPDWDQDRELWFFTSLALSVPAMIVAFTLASVGRFVNLAVHPTDKRAPSDSTGFLSIVVGSTCFVCLGSISPWVSIQSIAPDIPLGADTGLDGRKLGIAVIALAGLSLAISFSASKRSISKPISGLVVALVGIAELAIAVAVIGFPELHSGSSSDSGLRMSPDFGIYIVLVGGVLTLVSAAAMAHRSKSTSGRTTEGSGPAEAGG